MMEKVPNVFSHILKRLVAAFMIKTMFLLDLCKCVHACVCACVCFYEHAATMRIINGNTDTFSFEKQKQTKQAIVVEYI